MDALPYRFDASTGVPTARRRRKEATTTWEKTHLLTSIPNPRHDAEDDELRQGVQHEEAPSQPAQVGRPQKSRLSRFCWSNGRTHKHRKRDRTATGSEDLEADGSFI